ncbi:hypothetical protein PMAYCL1PPCAC_01997, partial [Pristionchus mayeri]
TRSLHIFSSCSISCSHSDSVQSCLPSLTAVSKSLTYRSTSDFSAASRSSIREGNSSKWMGPVLFVDGAR